MALRIAVLVYWFIALIQTEIAQLLYDLQDNFVLLPDGFTHFHLKIFVLMDTFDSLC